MRILFKFTDLNTNEIMDDARVARLERQLQEFTDKRDLIVQEIIQIKEDAKAIIDALFDEIMKDMAAAARETDHSIDASCHQFKMLLKKSKDLDHVKQKLSPVLSLISEAQTGKISTPL